MPINYRTSNGCYKIMQATSTVLPNFGLETIQEGVDNLLLGNHKRFTKTPLLKDKYHNFEVGIRCILMVNPYLLVCSYMK